MDWCASFVKKVFSKLWISKNTEWMFCASCGWNNTIQYINAKIFQSELKSCIIQNFFPQNIKNNFINFLDDSDTSMRQNLTNVFLEKQKFECCFRIRCYCNLSPIYLEIAFDFWQRQLQCVCKNLVFQDSAVGLCLSLKRWRIWRSPHCLEPFALKFQI